MITRHYLIRGRVQGVCFRASTVAFAKDHRISGWVRNLETGEVEVLAQGTAAQHNLLLAWLQRGPELAQVDSVAPTDWNDEEFSGFVTLSCALIPLTCEQLHSGEQ